PRTILQADRSLLRKLGVRVRRVEMVVPGGVVEAVEGYCSLHRIAIEIAGDPLGPIAQPARTFAARRGRVQIVAPVPPSVDRDCLGDTLGETVAGDRCANRIRPVGRAGCGRVIMRAMPGMKPTIEGNAPR